MVLRDAASSSCERQSLRLKRGWGRSRANTLVLWFGVLLVLSGRAETPRTDSNPLTGSLDGRLTDTRSVPLRMATVVVRNVATGEIAQAITARNGSYHFAGLGPGEYTLEASVPQLGKGAVEGILVSAGHVTRIQAALMMAAPIAVPLPTAAFMAIDPVAPDVTTEISPEEVKSLPLPNRDWAAFETENTTPVPVGQGQRRERNSIETEPALEIEIPESGLAIAASLEEEIADPTEFQPEVHGYREEGWDDHALTAATGMVRDEALANRSSVEEVRSSEVDANASPAPAKSRLHGEVSYEDRQRAWNALNPYTQWVQQTAPASGIVTAQYAALPYSPADARQSFGAGVGSQIQWKKMSWFAAGEGLLRNDPAVATVRHPNDFFAQPTEDDLTVLAARLGSPGTAPLEAGASAYSVGLQQMATLLGPVPRSSIRAQGLARIDAQITERQHLSMDSNFSYLNSPAGARTRSSETFGSHSFGNSQVMQGSATARWEDFLTANVLNAVSAKFRLHVLDDTPQAPSAFEQPLIDNAWGLLPEIIADSRYGFIFGKPAQLGRSNYPDEHVFSAEETLSLVRGKNLLRFGGSFEHLSDEVNALVNQTGTYSYADVLNVVSDVQSFEKFGLTDASDPFSAQHNCDETGRVHRSAGGLFGLGYLPCYAWYSQRIGPSDWHLSTNLLSVFAADQWQPMHRLTFSAGVRFGWQQLPSPISLVANASLPATETLPSNLRSLAPRLGFAWEPAKGTVLRVGAGMYFGQVGSAALLAALTQTGSGNGDLNYFFKPTDQGAPPFPYVFATAPQTVVTPGAVSFAGNYRVPEVDQGLVSVEQQLPSHWLVAATAMVSLGRRLPISIDTNLDPTQGPQTITYAVEDGLQAGPLKTSQLTVPFYTARLNPNYQQLVSIESRANSTYDAAMVRVTRSASHGLSLHAHYLYGHATDWNPNESWQVADNDVLDPRNFRAEYGTSDLDIRHTAGLSVIFQTPWKLNHWAGALANAWSVGTVGEYRSGRPFTMRTGGYVPGFYDDNKKLIEGVATGMNGSGGDNRVYGVGRNTYRYPATWTGDARLGKRFELPHQRELTLFGESFNLFNHQNVTRIETTGYTIYRGSEAGDLPTLNFLTGFTKAGLPSTVPEFGKPLDVNATNTYHPREFQLGVRARF